MDEPTRRFLEQLEKDAEMFTKMAATWQALWETAKAEIIDFTGARRTAQAMAASYSHRASETHQLIEKVRAAH